MLPLPIARPAETHHDPLPWEDAVRLVDPERPERTPRLRWDLAPGGQVAVWEYDLSASASAPDLEPLKRIAREREPHTAPSRPFLFIGVHGFRGEHHGFEQLVLCSAALFPESIWWVPDLPGFGASAASTAAPAPQGRPAASPPEHSAQGYAQLIDVLFEQGLRRFPGHLPVLVGHSFGSVVLSRTSAISDARLHTAVLINPISRPALEQLDPLSAAAASLYYQLALRLPPGPGLALLRSPLPTEVMTLLMRTARTPVLRGYIRHQHNRFFSCFQEPQVLAEAYASSVADSVRERASLFRRPTLLITGEKDAFGSPASQRALAQSMPEARIAQLGGVGHLIHYERAPEALLALGEFLSTLSTPVRGDA